MEPEDFFARDTTIEMARWLINGGYRRDDAEVFERGIAEKWDDQEYWAKAVGTRLGAVIHELTQTGASA